MTLIIKAPGKLTSPGGAPRLPDTTTGLLLDYDAATLTVANGAPVNTWTPVAGSVPLISTTAAGRVSPTLRTGATPSGAAAVRFNPAAPSVLYADTTLPTTLTVAAVIRSLSPTAGGDQRIFTGIAGTFYSLRIGTAGYRLSSPSLNTNTGHMPSTTWEVVVAVFDGAVSRFHRDDETSLALNVPAPASVRGISVGDNWPDANPVAPGNARLWNGEVARLQAFSRALTQDDAEALVTTLAARYGL